MGAFIDITGQRFGRWTAVTRSATRLGWSKQAFWECVCDCGTTRLVAGHYLRSGASASCGCMHRERASAQATKHGLVNSVEYRAVWSARSRCQSPRNRKYQDYGGRGIEYRLPLNPGDAAQLLIEAIGLRPSSRHSLDRIDNNGHYEIGNIRWATAHEQANNQRPKRTRARG